MKNLTLLNDVTNIKLGDTATTIQFKQWDGTQWNQFNLKL